MNNFYKICFVILIFICSQSVCFASNVDVQLNGKILDFTDSLGNIVEAQIINDRTMVPMRRIFEELDTTVEWDGTTRSITAYNNDVTIKLQIGNVIATKIADDISSTITLDSPPVIVNDRTLVPLRFIAESLGKQVDWDDTNRTAIIIDYDYFVNKFYTSAGALCMAFDMEGSDFSKTSKILLTRNYIDNLDNAKNTTFLIESNINEKKLSSIINEKVSIKFSGTNDLAKDIIRERWNDIAFEVEFGEKDFSYFTSNQVLAKIWNTSVNKSKTARYSDYSLKGRYSQNIEGFIKQLLCVDDKYIDISTFETLENEFSDLCDVFNSYNVNEKNSYKWSFNSSNLLDSSFDFSRFDNEFSGNTISRLYNFLNKTVFGYDVKFDELVYDYSKIEVNGYIAFEKDSNIIKSDIQINLYNNYDEAIQWVISIEEKLN